MNGAIDQWNLDVKVVFCKFFQETHIMHEFPADFYGSQLAVCVAGYIREEKKFSSLGMYLQCSSLTVSYQRY